MYFILSDVVVLTELSITLIRQVIMDIVLVLRVRTIIVNGVLLVSIVIFCLVINAGSKHLSHILSGSLHKPFPELHIDSLFNFCLLYYFRRAFLKLPYFGLSNFGQIKPFVSLFLMQGF